MDVQRVPCLSKRWLLPSLIVSQLVALEAWTGMMLRNHRSMAVNSQPASEAGKGNVFSRHGHALVSSSERIRLVYCVPVTKI